MTVPLVKETNDFGELMKPVPPTSELTAPSMIPFMARVITMGDIPSMLTPKPFTAPAPRLTNRATTIAAGRPVEGAREFVIIAAMVIVHGTERSTPPTRSTNVWDIASIPRTEAWASSSWVWATLKKPWETKQVAT